MKPADLPPVRASPRPALTRMETVYLAVLMHWYRHRRHPPSLAELVEQCQLNRATLIPTGHTKLRDWPSRPSLYKGLLACESKGYVRRNNEGRFEVTK